MATGMARHGSVGAFSGFSVCQPALGAPLQFLPAIGTPELDAMINAFLPGPASIQDKRAHISMDFFEYSRQTGENFKFYPVPAGSFASPVTASPASSSLYDSGYASSLNPSPVLSDHGAWTQSPVAVAGVASDARTKARPSVSKKSSASSSRQQTVDFANHPGMRILTKDGRDVTNSASRGCKTKEQRDHAHLMRIIKACDSCRKKKVRCDPSHRKRNASQASTLQAEQKPAKKSKKAEDPPPVAALDAPIDFVADVFASETMLSMPPLDAAYAHDLDQFWSDFVTFDQEATAVAAAAAEPAIDEFLYNSFTDPQSFFSPSSGSTSTSPSQSFTPFTPVRSGASPTTAREVVPDVAAEVSVVDPTVPYLNPGVAHGTNYVDFNLYSPGPEVFDEDPGMQMRDLASLQHSPQSHSLIAGNSFCAQTLASAGECEPSGEQSRSVAASPVGRDWYYDPGSTVRAGADRTICQLSTNRRSMTNHNRFVEDETGVRWSPIESQPTNHVSVVDGERYKLSELSSPVSHTSTTEGRGGRCGDATSTVTAAVAQSSVSPRTPPRPGLIPAPGTPDVPSSPAVPESPVNSSLPTGSIGRQLSHSTIAHTALVAEAVCEWSCVVRGVPGSSARNDGQQVVQQGNVAASAASATTALSNPPTRCTLVGMEDDKSKAVIFLSQLAVFGLVSLLCATALHAHLASQANLAYTIAITSISLARLSARPPFAATTTTTKRVVASDTSPSPMPSSIIDSVKSKIQSVNRSLGNVRSTVSQRAGSLVPRLPSVRTIVVQ